MDYIYAKLNKEVESVSFSGLKTATTLTTVDNSNKTIKVDVLDDGRIEKLQLEVNKIKQNNSTPALADVVWDVNKNNTLKFINTEDEVIKEIELSPFVQEQSDFAQQDENSETFIRNKSTKYLLNEGEDGIHKYVTEDKLQDLDVGGLKDIVVQGEGNAITEAELSEDGKSVLLHKNKTFIESNDLSEFKSTLINHLELTMDNSTYVVTLKAKDINGNSVCEDQTIDLPLESTIVDGNYDSATKSVNLILKSGSTISFKIEDLVSGLQNMITNDNKLSSNLVDDTNAINKFVTTEQLTKLNAIQDQAQKNVQSDWGVTDTTSDAFILNKPTKLSDFENDLNINVDLTNYYTKDQIYTKQETYTKAEIEALIQSTIDSSMEATINEIMEGSY